MGKSAEPDRDESFARQMLPMVLKALLKLPPHPRTVVLVTVEHGSEDGEFERVPLEHINAEVRPQLCEQAVALRVLLWVCEGKRHSLPFAVYLPRGAAPTDFVLKPIFWKPGGWN